MIIWWHIDSPAAIVRLNFSINSTCDLRSTMSCANSKKSKRGSNVTVFPAEPTYSDSCDGLLFVVRHGPPRNRR